MKNTLSMKRSFLTGSLLVVLLLSLVVAAGCPSQTKSKEQIELAKTNALDPSSGATSEKVPGVAADSASVTEASGGSAGAGSTIEVFGSSELLVKPDTIVIDLDVTTRAKDAVNAKDANNKIMAKVTDAALKFGVPKNKIQTLGFNISPEYNFANEKQTLVGYIASNIIEITYDNIDKSGELIDLLVNSGATGVSGLRFTVSDPSEVKADGAILAVKDARIKAEKIAKESGLTIVGIKRILELEEGSPVFDMSHGGFAAGAVEKESVPVSAGENKITSKVNVVFSVK